MVLLHSLADSEDWRPFAQLDLPLGDNLDSLPPWFASVYSENDPFQFTIKAWCSVSKGCNLSCSDPDSGPCVSPPTCRCIRDVNVSTCTIGLLLHVLFSLDSHGLGLSFCSP
jgi:hypothetical protein